MPDIKKIRSKLAKQIDDLVAEAGMASHNIDEAYGEASPEGYVFNAILIALERAYTIAAESEQAADKQFGVTVLPSHRIVCSNTMHLTKEK